ncbi:polysaccharide deacetylase [Variibacter gotjawalensis]|uniref:Chitooligosaccharide deacetylase n=1 Tax=Variibacter gotjawalensis TaxID=1333996 RepID=A0A0S3PX01_9BRAD|nr:polysaccharide deacetylase family protein [Variibacter gotjawalensis]NIK46258.1 peptidoglycan/xylan/chitin deacetylase (PgdA/CDA1 family) [Variibacter gotjawalensis]RZS48173.1 peptidoglycan/xylan/chitin deacetylase (PgdA/CDA1 family) [Variibacter gotjawalensis]BAT60430.1 polysaccharide deacetylase [Variibacter gotjawalensis]
MSLRHAAIKIGLESIAFTNAHRWFPSAAGRGVVFTLHHVRPETGRVYEPNAILSITPEFLDAAIVEAKQLGYRAVALHDLPALLADTANHEKFFAFTLDDGCRDNAEFAAPAFRKHDVPYTLFITKGFVERTHGMWWETVEELTRETDELRFDFGQGDETLDMHSTAAKTAAFRRFAAFVESINEDVAVARIDAAARAHGIDPLVIVARETMGVGELSALIRDPLASFGAHTVSHCNLARVSSERLRQEIGESAAGIQEWTGRMPTTLAYPYGWKRACGPREAEAARDAGLSVAVTTQPGVLKDQENSWRLLPRVSLNGLYQKPRYVRALLSGIPFQIPGA